MSGVPAIQLGFHFPEYEFTEGEVVRLCKADLDSMPFIVTRRSFYDERSYMSRANASPEEPENLYTAWYYVVKSMYPNERGRYYTDAVNARMLEKWKWAHSDQRWEA
jgi:hypothetical protein